MDGVFIGKYNWDTNVHSNVGTIWLYGNSVYSPGKFSQSGTPSSGGDLVTVDYGNAHYSPGGWTCTVRTNTCAASYTCTVYCSGSEKVLNGGCYDVYDSTWPEHPVNQGWMCDYIYGRATRDITVYANCCY